MNSQNNNPEVRSMLERLYELLNQSYPDPVTAWDRLMAFLILDHRPLCLIAFDESIEWFFKDSIVDEFMKVYDPELLKSDYYDHLGEMYFEKFISSQKTQAQGQYPSSMSDVENLTDKVIGQTSEERTVLDPDVGTGRRLMAFHKVAPKAVLFGVGKDLRLLRIAYVNFAIHDIRGYLLHADIEKHEIDISTNDGQHNWQYANKWHSWMDKLKVIKTQQTKGSMNRQ